jgi:hypothetical protein
LLIQMSDKSSFTCHDVVKYCDKQFKNFHASNFHFVIYYLFSNKHHMSVLTQSVDFSSRIALQTLYFSTVFEHSSYK